MKKTLSLLEENFEEEPQINLTPLIDVVFVILIMFILVAPLVEIDKVQLARGGEQQLDTPPLSAKSGVKIYVHKDNTIWLNGAPLSIDELKGQLMQLYLAFPSSSPQIFHDREAFFGTYQAVKNAAEKAGFSSIDVILQPG